MSEQRPWLRFATFIAVAALVASASGAQTTPTPGATPTAAGPTATPAPSGPAFAGDSWDAGCANYPNNAGEIDHVTAKDKYTVEFGLCHPDASFLSKIAFVTGGIMDKDWIAQTGSDPNKPYLDQPNGTGSLMVKAGDWIKGEKVTLTRFDNYWGTDKAKLASYVIRWGTEPSQRLLELQSGSVDGIDNVGPTDFETVKNDANLQVFTRDALNVLYMGMNNTIPPFDNEKVRQAIAMGIDRQRIVDNFFPPGSSVASHFAPCSILGACEGDDWYAFDKTAAQTLLAEGLKEAGMTSFPKMKIYYRNVNRAYLPNPPQVAAEFQTQLMDNLGIDAAPTELESGTMVTNFNNGLLDGFFLFGWLQDWPDMTDWLDIHFSANVLGFGTAFFDLAGTIAVAGQVIDENQRKAFYKSANNLLREHVPMVPIAHAASAVAYKKTVVGAYADPNTEERFYTMSIDGADTLTFMQGAEPLSLFPADESDGESLRFGNQIYQPLYDFELKGVKPIPALADSCTPASDNLTWTCTLHQGVTFHNGADFDANDVVATYKVLIDAKDPAHVGNTGDFYYSYTMWGSLLNPPPAPAS
jgi:peptide/nickel transport system substrate-binding protein